MRRRAKLMCTLTAGVGLLLGALAAPPGGLAQGEGQAGQPAAAAQQGEAGPQPSAQTTEFVMDSAGFIAGLPPRARDPRTLHEYWPVFAGFTVVWLGIMAYALSLGGRLKRVAKAVAASAGEGRTGV